MSRTLPILCVFLLAFAQALPANATRDPGEYFFDQTLGDFSEELQVARDQDKAGVLIMFEMDECPFCHRMKTTVLSQARVQDYYKKHFMIYSVDIEGDVEIMDFAGQPMKQKDFASKQQRVRATPVFAFFDLEGKPVQRYTGATANADEFLWLGRFVAEGAYRDTSFIRYKRARKQETGR